MSADGDVDEDDESLDGDNGRNCCCSIVDDGATTSAACGDGAATGCSFVFGVVATGTMTAATSQKLCDSMAVAVAVLQSSANCNRLGGWFVFVCLFLGWPFRISVGW